MDTVQHSFRLQGSGLGVLGVPSFAGLGLRALGLSVFPKGPKDPIIRYWGLG